MYNHLSVYKQMSYGLFKNVIYKLYNKYKENVALNNL